VKRRGHPGDLLVRVKIVTPKSLSTELKDLYQKIADLEGNSAAGGGFFSGFMGKKKAKK
jgi:molecular chaperone DnaJ